MDTDTEYLCTPEDAAALFSDINADLEAVENNIREVIRLRAWEPLGYETFTEAWQDKMKGRLLAMTVRADVVFQMFKEGADDEAVITALGAGSGVAASTLEALRAEHDLGLSPDQATGRPARQQRERSGSAVIMRIEWDRREVRELRKKALARGVDFEAKCREFIEEGFKALLADDEDTEVAQAQ